MPHSDVEAASTLEPAMAQVSAVLCYLPTPFAPPSRRLFAMQTFQPPSERICPGTRPPWAGGRHLVFSSRRWNA
jgi:hypothetical protein